MTTEGEGVAAAARRRPVAKLSNLEAGRLTPVMLGRGRIVLVKIASDEVHAFAARCPHQGADLGQGCLADLVVGDGLNQSRVEAGRPVVRCPWHGFEYDLASGEPTVAAPEHRPMRLRTFPVEIDGDDVVVVG